MRTRKQSQRPGCRRRELSGEVRSVGGDGLAHIAPDRFVTLERISQGGTRGQEGGHAAFSVRRHTQKLKGISRRFTHAQQKDGRAVGVVIHAHRQHVVLEFTGLAGGIAQLIAHTGTDIAQLFLRAGLVGRPQAGVDGLAQIHLAHISA